MAESVAQDHTRPVRAAGRRRRRAAQDGKGWLFVGPFMVVFALVFLAPIVYSIYLSLFRDQLIGGNRSSGWTTTPRRCGDPKFWEAFGRVALFLVVQVPIMLLPRPARRARDRQRPAARRRLLPDRRSSCRTRCPPSSPTLMWGFIYGNQFGLVANLNDLLGTTAIQPLARSWMLASIGNIVTWEFVGYNMLIFYAALRVVPGRALRGGRDRRRRARSGSIRAIKLPALRGAIVIATIFSIIGSFQLFNEPNILRTLAPNVITTYFTPNMYAYNLSFAGQQYNYSATVAIVMGVITMVIAYVVQLRGIAGGDLMTCHDCRCTPRAASTARSRPDGCGRRRYAPKRSPSCSPCVMALCRALHPGPAASGC